MRTVLAHRDFRLLWAGQSLSTLGDLMVFTALGLFVVELNGSATDLGVVLFAYTAPLVVFLLMGGVIGDRLPRHRVVVVTDWIRGGLHGLLAVLIVTDTVQVWHMVVIGLLFGTAEAFFRPAATGLLPQTVPEELIQQGNATLGTFREAAFFIGPAIGTALVLGVGGAAAFAADAATFAVSVLLLARIRPRLRGDVVPSAAAASPLRELREGWSAVRERAWVWATILAFSITLLIALAPFFVLGPVIATEVYGERAAYGVVTTATGGGAVIGTLIALRFKPLFPVRTGMLACLLWPLSWAVYAAGPPIWVAAAFCAAGGAGGGLFGVLWETTLAQRIPPHLLSRVTAYDWMGSLALMPLGYLIAGPVGEAVGAQEALLAGSLVGLAVLALGLLPRSTWRLQRLEDVKSGSPSSVVEASA